MMFMDKGLNLVDDARDRHQIRLLPESVHNLVSLIKE